MTPVLLRSGTVSLESTRPWGGHANLKNTVPCGDPEGYYRVSEILGSGKSADCPTDRSAEGYFPSGVDRGKYSTSYFEADGKTFCLLWHQQN